MDALTESRYSLPYKFPVTSNDNDASKSEGQAIEDYLTGTIDNKSEYEISTLYVSAILNWAGRSTQFGKSIQLINFGLHSNLENPSN